METGIIRKSVVFLLAAALFSLPLTAASKPTPEREFRVLIFDPDDIKGRPIIVSQTNILDALQEIPLILDLAEGRLAQRPAAQGAAARYRETRPTEARPSPDGTLDPSHAFTDEDLKEHDPQPQ